jgi:hypothetical protein
MSALGHAIRRPHIQGALYAPPKGAWNAPQIFSTDKPTASSPQLATIGCALRTAVWKRLSGRVRKQLFPRPIFDTPPPKYTARPQRATAQEAARQHEGLRRKECQHV